MGSAETSEELGQAQILAEAESLLGAGRPGAGGPRPSRRSSRHAWRLSSAWATSTAGAWRRCSPTSRLVEERRKLEVVEDDLARLEQAERELGATYLEPSQRAAWCARREAGLVLCREVVRVLARLGMARVELRLALRRREPQRVPAGGRRAGRAWAGRH